MLIVALQDDIDNLYAIWNTVTDRFLGVNLDRDFAMDAIIQYKHCSIAEANSRLDNPQPFVDIAKHLCDGFYDSRAKEWLLSEIKITNGQKCMYAEYFDGVPVDNETRIKLCESHIRFCKRVIEQLR